VETLSVTGPRFPRPAGGAFPGLVPGLNPGPSEIRCSAAIEPRSADYRSSRMIVDLQLCREAKIRIARVGDLD
jgi:hypothetical protein